ncbi:alpha/beta hydrolase [Rathayibacter sp. CAU 1779]
MQTFEGASVPICHALRPAATHPHRNTSRRRGTVVVFPGRGETEELYERLGDRLAYDGYDVVVTRLPPLEEIDSAWLDAAAPPAGATLEGLAAAGIASGGIAAVSDLDPSDTVTLIGSDSGSVVAALLAARWEVDAVVLAGIGGLGAWVAPASDEERIAQRTSCVVHRGRLAALADLSAPAAQTFRPEIVYRLQETTLTVPVLAVHGSDDPITGIDEALGAYRSLSASVELVVVAGGVHDALNDATHRTVSAEIVQFLERKGAEPIIRRTVSIVEGVAA